MLENFLSRATNCLMIIENEIPKKWSSESLYTNKHRLMPFFLFEQYLSSWAYTFILNIPYLYFDILISTKINFVDPDNAKNELLISSLLINLYHEFLLSFNRTIKTNESNTKHNNNVSIKWLLELFNSTQSYEMFHYLLSVCVLFYYLIRP